MRRHDDRSATCGNAECRPRLSSLWVELQEHTGASLTLGVCYRSQSAAYSEIREMFTAIGQASKGRCLIVGDFNYPTINWDVLEGNNKDEEEFLDVLQDNFLLQHVDGPTGDGNILDLVMSNEIAMVDDLRILEHFSSSDHNMIDFELVVTTGGLDTVIYKYDFKQGNYKAIKNVLSEVNWSEIFFEKNTLECYKILSDKLSETIASYVPVKKSNIKKNLFMAK